MDLMHDTVSIKTMSLNICPKFLEITSKSSIPKRKIINDSFFSINRLASDKILFLLIVLVNSSIS